MPDDQRQLPPGAARQPGTSWDDLAAADTKPVPDFLLGEHYKYLGSDPIPTARYTSPDFYSQEVEKMWPNVWQFAARLEELPNPGDTVVYENVGKSWLLTRQNDGSIKAMQNVCLHRGRKLRTESGKASSFYCGYHGFNWNIDGSLRNIPCRWDFPHLTNEKMKLPEAQVGVWEGYVFIKEAEGGPTLEEFLAPLPEHFARWGQDDCYTAVWAARVCDANWKAVAEAFMEAYHVIATHPQLMDFSGDCMAKYYVLSDNVNLALTPFGVPSPHLGSEPKDPQWVIDSYLKNNGRVAVGIGQLQVQPGQTARAAMGAVNRKRFGEAAGIDASHYSDCELQDAFTYNVFPNFAPWGGFMPNVVYRWRPWGDADHTLMEVRVLARQPKGAPKPPIPKMRMLTGAETWADVAEFGPLGGVLNQDWDNLPFVQAGMKAMKSGQIELANYQEVRVRHFHQTLDKYLKS